MELNGKVVVITGVSKGIGKATAELLLQKGCKVIGLGRTNSLPLTDNYYFATCDIRKFENVEKAIIQGQAVLGESIHILINNAGLGYFGKLEDHTLNQWHQMYETNVNGIFYTCKMVIPVMKHIGFGHIVNIASVAGLEGYPEVSGYCGSKFAVKGISEALYKELRDYKIKVTCVYPGSVKTDFFTHSPGIQPHDYMLMPEDVAAMLVWSLETPDNFHQVNLEVRPLQPKGPKK